VVVLLLQGVLSSLRQLLEEGYFHADPHPGNVVVTREGVLAYFDFGMMSEFRWEYRIGLIRTVCFITISVWNTV
jgi:aarF domain-containing kinase